jgi:hypothetical protein
VACPVRSRPPSPSSSPTRPPPYETLSAVDATPPGLAALGDELQAAAKEFAVISPVSPSHPSQARPFPVSSPEDARVRSAFLAYTGLDPTTPRSALPTPSGPLLQRLPNGTVTRDMLYASLNPTPIRDSALPPVRVLAPRVPTRDHPPAPFLSLCHEHAATSADQDALPVPVASDD